jgi:hypothetical protein
MAYDEAADRSVTIAIMGDELTPSERKHYAELIVKAVNAHDALVAALVCAEADLEGLVSESEQDDHPAWQTLKEIRTALGAAK